MTRLSTATMAPRMARYQRVRRRRAALNMGRSGGAKGVADPAHGMDERRAKRSVHFVAQIADVDIDHVAFHVGVGPDMLGQQLAGEYLAGMVDQIFKERVFTGGKGKFLATAPGAAGRRVEFQVAD